MNRREEIEVEAAGWLARVDRGLGREEEMMFARWKEADIEHRIVFLQLQATWQRADQLAAMHPPSPAASRLPRRLALKVAAIAAVLVMCVSLGLTWRAQEIPPQRFETAIGAKRSLNLPDGTHVELNTDTVIHASMTSRTRTVTLDRGEAYFEVVHDDDHPFVVIAGNRRITDLGTKFSVRRDGDRVDVVVTEGEVRVEHIAADQVSAPVVAQRNMVVIARDRETLVTTKPLKEIDNAMLWRSGMLSFNQEPLAAVAADINRYNTRKIEVVGPARDIRIGGSFRSDNIEGFTQLLRDGFRLKIVETDDKIVISN
jgi:transmembrane sensor